MSGVTMHQGEIVRGRDGMPLMRAEAIVDNVTWQSIQAVLDRPAGRNTGTRQSRLLLHVARCALCDSALYGKSNGRNLYYHCPGTTPARGNLERCPAMMVRTDWLDPLAVALFLGQVGHIEIQERVPAADDGRAELAEIGQAIVDLEAERFVHGIQRDGYDDMVAALKARHSQISAPPASPSMATYRPTGQTYRDMWSAT